MARKPSSDTPIGPFRGFGPGALPFLTGLAANQTRDWYVEHMAIYERDLKTPLGALVEALAFAFSIHDIPLTGDAKRSLFRMHRDVRFSKDKSPYKTNAGATLTRDGTKMANGLLYIQIGGEEGSMMAAGFYGLEPGPLARFRHAIADDQCRWRDVESALAEAGLGLSMGNALTRAPKGFEDFRDSPVSGVFRLRNFVVSRPIAEARLADEALIDDIVDFTLGALPLLRYGWAALVPRADEL